MPDTDRGAGAPWICIGRVGTFEDSQGREHTFTEGDLDAICTGYDPAQSEAPLAIVAVAIRKRTKPANGCRKAGIQLPS